jgi:hypothetical protein
MAQNCRKKGDASMAKETTDRFEEMPIIALRDAGRSIGLGDYATQTVLQRAGITPFRNSTGRAKLSISQALAFNEAAKRRA